MGVDNTNFVEYVVRLRTVADTSPSFLPNMLKAGTKCNIGQGLVFLFHHPPPLASIIQPMGLLHALNIVEGECMIPVIVRLGSEKLARIM